MNGNIEINACPLCGSTGFEAAFKKDIYTGKRCTQCKLVYISPRAEDTDKVYMNDEASSPSKYYLLSKEHDKLTFQKRFRIIEQFSDGRDFLDIGCNTGNFLAVASEKGWNTVGIEPNPKAAQVCRQSGFTVEQNFLTESISSKYAGSFNAVYMGDVIEHVADPLNMLKLALNMLKRNGIMMIVTPDFDSFIARLFQIKPLEHIIYFNKSSLMYAADMLRVKTELISKTTRKRSLNALSHSTTFSGKPVQKSILKGLSALYADTLVNAVLQTFVKDEILMVIRKQ